MRNPWSKLMVANGLSDERAGPKPRHLAARGFAGADRRTMQTANQTHSNGLPGVTGRPLRSARRLADRYSPNQN